MKRILLKKENKMKLLLKRWFIGFSIGFTIGKGLNKLAELYIIRYDKKHPEDLERFAEIREEYNF